MSSNSSALDRIDGCTIGDAVWQIRHNGHAGVLSRVASTEPHSVSGIARPEGIARLVEIAESALYCHVAMSELREVFAPEDPSSSTTCLDCNDTGRTECDECDGDGHVECQCSCGHLHEADCEACEGSGEVDCPCEPDAEIVPVRILGIGDDGAGWDKRLIAAVMAEMPSADVAGISVAAGGELLIRVADQSNSYAYALVMPLRLDRTDRPAESIVLSTLRNAA